MKPLILEWLRRYLPAELLSAAATLAGALLAFRSTHSGVAAALAATWAGNVVYFGYLLLLDARLAYRQRRALGRPYTVKTFARNVRALAVEFGLAELADSFLIRPALMYYLPRWLGSLAGGILLAKLLADISFYIPAIVGYELSKKRFRDFR
ncbi:hypothetical protein LJY25_11815 [Hymenobacter sp. BT175]|uniref:hypothetical protein n=1 Tax=Hymenobacter translucens TaxID=2886507 RepID=UPI001D0F30C2|nr:hypothetical protein [Hymenobacter translucens]MCC2547135.1 hypothetical protein [Hymenobacter translucens]